jgi:hypothetical protein
MLNRGAPRHGIGRAAVQDVTVTVVVTVTTFGITVTAALYMVQGCLYNPFGSQYGS